MFFFISFTCRIAHCGCQLTFSFFHFPSKVIKMNTNVQCSRRTFCVPFLQICTIKFFVRELINSFFFLIFFLKCLIFNTTEKKIFFLFDAIFHCCIRFVVTHMKHVGIELNLSGLLTTN